MSLFVGQISRNATSKTLTELFENYGECSVKFKGSYAFVDFKKREDAKKALEEANGQDMNGLRLAIEWSHRGAGG
jgi:RNA recognition motif-containing protein